MDPDYYVQDRGPAYTDPTYGVKPMEPKTTYVYLERIGEGPKLGGYDSFLATWSNSHWQGVLEVAMEEIDAGTPYTVKLTVLDMTADEHDQFCRDHELDVTGDMAS